MRVLLFFFLLFSSSLLAQHHYPDKPSTHGMMLMGTTHLYASHLPMFHSPHDYQIILELEMDETSMKKYKEDRMAHPEETVFTLEPEIFVLPEMVQHTKKFKGAIYRGHFERGGTKIIDAVSFVIAEVVYMKQFAKEERPANLQYILFGNNDEQFLAHRISIQPDFDEHISIRIQDKQILKRLKKSHIIIEFNEPDQRKGFSWKTHTGTILSNSKPLNLLDPALLYLEFGDLD